MLPILQVGPLAVQLPGLLLLAGLWLGLALSEKYARRRAVQANDLYNLVFIALIAGVLGARLVYTLRYPAAFAANPAGLFSLNPGLFDPFGGLAAGCLAALIFGQRKQLDLWRTLDALTPLLAVLAIALALANLASGNGYGAPADLPWSIELWGARRHPTQIYEGLLAGLGLGLFWPARRIWAYRAVAAPGVRRGVYILAFLAYSAAARLLTEAFRGDSLLLPGGLRAAQVITWIVLALCLWGIDRLQRGAPGIADSSQ